MSGKNANNCSPREADISTSNLIYRYEDENKQQALQIEPYPGMMVNQDLIDVDNNASL